MRKPYKVVNHTYDLRIEGQEWRRELLRDSLFHAIAFAYKQKPDDQTDMLFLIQENHEPHREQFFCMPYQMWDALCETPEVMTMYLRIGGFR